MCPEIDPPTTPSFYAFSYTVPSEGRAARSFVAAGSGEAREGGPSYEGRIIRPGDHSPEAMREKASFVLGASARVFVTRGVSAARPRAGARVIDNQKGDERNAAVEDSNAARATPRSSLSADPVSKPAAHTPARKAGVVDPSKPAAGERLTLRWSKGGSNSRSRHGPP